MLIKLSRLGGVTVNKYAPEKSNYLLGNSYSLSTYLLVNKYFPQERSNPLEIVWRVVFSHLNTLGSSIFLGNIPANIYLFKVNNRNTRTQCEICSVNKKSMKLIYFSLIVTPSFQNSTKNNIKLQYKPQYDNCNML